MIFFIHLFTFRVKLCIIGKTKIGGDNLNISNIKKNADKIYVQHRKQIIPEFFYVGYISLLAQYLRSGLFSFFVSLFLSPIAHGYVVCAIKLVEVEKVKLSYQDSMVGIVDFIRVAPAYITRKIVILSVTFLVGLPSLIMLEKVYVNFYEQLTSTLGNVFIQADFYVPNFIAMIELMDYPFIIINVLICMLVFLYLSALFTPVPYMMELDDLSWNECFSYSIHLMKGHMINFFKLYLSYCIRHIVYWIVIGLMILWVGSINELLMLFCLVTSLFFYIEIFKGRFEIAKYLFYKEIRGEQHEKHQDN